jgi:hypothetical protein
LYWRRGIQVVNSYAGKSDTSYRGFIDDGHRLVGPGDTTRYYYDREKNRFLGMFKFYCPEGLPNGNLLRSRAFAFLERIDRPFDTNQIERVNLVPMGTEARGDKPCDEYYATSGWRYESVWLGELKVWHGCDDYPYSSSGCAFLKLVSSRDGLDWQKVSYFNEDGFTEVFIPNGEEGGNGGRNDGGYLCLFGQGPLRIDEELIFYYGGSSYGKNQPDEIRVTGGGIFRARLRVDGFVSVDSGSLMTRPLICDAKELHINGIGPIVVEVLNERKALLASATVEGDSLEHLVDLKEQVSLRLPKEEPIRLRFTVKEGGRLYSFFFGKRKDWGWH